jgi:hypothetical protein
LRSAIILQLPDALPCNAPFLSDFRQSFGLLTAEPETLVNDFPLAKLQHFIKQSADLISEIID